MQQKLRIDTSGKRPATNGMSSMTTKPNPAAGISNGFQPSSGLNANQLTDEQEEDRNASPSPTLESESQIDYSKVYALHTFVANLEGQVSVLKGDELELLDDSNSYWWFVRCLKTKEVGYIPAENIETPHERLARLNRHRNVGVSQANEDDIQAAVASMKAAKHSKSISKSRRIRFSSEPDQVFTDEYSASESEMEEMPKEEPKIDSLERNSGGSSNTGQQTSSGKRLLQKIFKTGIFKGSKSDSASSSTSDTSIALSNPSETVQSNVAASTDGPINILRIYSATAAGVEARFKTVQFTETMNAREVIENALKKFRSNGIPDEYFLSIQVNHPSGKKDKIMENHEILFIVMEGLRHELSAELSRIARSVGKQGSISNLRITDDALLKVFMHRQNRPGSVEIQIKFQVKLVLDIPGYKGPAYHIIEVSGEDKVGDIIDYSKKSFLLLETLPGPFSLYSAVSGNESELIPEEDIIPIVRLAQAKSFELTLILRVDRSQPTQRVDDKALPQKPLQAPTQDEKDDDDLPVGMQRTISGGSLSLKSTEPAVAFLSRTESETRMSSSKRDIDLPSALVSLESLQDDLAMYMKTAEPTTPTSLKSSAQNPTKSEGFILSTDPTQGSHLPSKNTLLVAANQTKSSFDKMVDLLDEILQKDKEETAPKPPPKDDFAASNIPKPSFTQEESILHNSEDSSTYDWKKMYRTLEEDLERTLQKNLKRVSHHARVSRMSMASFVTLQEKAEPLPPAPSDALDVDVLYDQFREADHSLSHLQEQLDDILGNVLTSFSVPLYL